MHTMVFVCYGNICRSPFAEHYARKRFSERGISEWAFRSAGVGAVPGAPSPKAALQAAARLGVDLGPHRALHVRDLQIVKDDLLIAMDRHVFGELAEQIGTTLAEVRGPGGAPVRLLMQELIDPSAPGLIALDVPDPMGLDVRSYLSSYELISRAIDRMLERLEPVT